jgi:sarcosine oxidase gamma subunit
MRREADLSLRGFGRMTAELLERLGLEEVPAPPAAAVRRPRTAALRAGPDGWVTARGEAERVYLCGRREVGDG